MKIIKHTSDALVIRDCPGRILFACLCIIAIAGSALAGLADSYTNENKISEYGVASVLLFSLVGLVIGGSIIYDHHLIYTKLNKNLNTGFVHTIGIFKNETRSYRLDEIEDIIITESENPEGRCFYAVALKLKDAQKIPISSSCWINDEGLKSSAESMKEFLNTKSWQFSHSRIYELLRVSCKAACLTGRHV